MALLKAKAWKYGLQTTYWSIEEPNINYYNKTARITLLGFISEASKKIDNEQPTDSISFDFNAQYFPFVKTQTMEDIYTIIKQSKLDLEGNETNFFVDAQNI